ncbi:hypothetical protein RND71_022088 [Anisodus tanguticus]|uniref:Uncharacterized protein n=1 Tax=Anisodus tanguticus TaxID=243964 RepID=A0AAE1VFV7_9SOLA|nr:hypothetical protein RND71_022088 [Anisodus tanguticus]
MAGDLFEDLPPPAVPPSSANGTAVASPAPPLPSLPPPPSLKSALKRTKPPPQSQPERDFAFWVELVARGLPSGLPLLCGLRAIAQELDYPVRTQKASAPEKKRLRFKTTMDASETQVIEAMQKIASHIKNTSKFSKASKLALQLIQAGSVKPATSDHFFAILEAAMSSLTACNEPSVRADYHELFIAAQDTIECLSKKQQNMITTWTMRAVVANDLFTDESFTFIEEFYNASGFLDTIALVGNWSYDLLRTTSISLSAITHFGDHSKSLQHRVDPTRFGRKCGCGSRTGFGQSNLCALTTPMANKYRIKEAISNLPVATEDDDGEEAAALKEKTQAVSEEAQTDNKEESDPFGLDDLIPSTSKKDDKSKGKRVTTTKARKGQEEEETKRFLRSQREALLSCLEIAANRYKTPGCQTSIDILVKHAFDSVSRFTSRQRDAIEKLWASVREQQIRRKQGKSVSGKLDVNAFEHLQAKYANEKISIRRAVGGSGDRKCQQWLG